ncbi:MAG: hypothetical protein J6P78_04745, partial [Lachnospiraceae bacterium]|nr:hypothetical protein [Lachnospiraceae bacterium]
MALKGWIKKYEHQYHEVPASDDLNAPEDINDDVFSTDDEREMGDDEAAGVSNGGRVLSRMISYISNESLIG